MNLEKGIVKQVLFDNLWLAGELVFSDDSILHKQKIITKGFRFVIWKNSGAHSTSAVIVSDCSIVKGDKKDVEIVLLASFNLKSEIAKGLTLNIGSSTHKIGKFTVTRLLGFWNKEIP